MKNKVELIYSILSGTASPEEEIQFRVLMEQEENRSLYNQLKKIWDRSGEVKDYRLYDTQKAFYDLSQNIKSRKQIRKRNFVIAVSGIAAGILLMLGLLKLTDFPSQNRQQASVAFRTESGNRSVIVLPDSSKVWLNAQTEIRYAPDFGKTDRSVFLSGECFFEVKHSDKPFIVNLKEFKIKVYGTKFNVSAYSDDQSVSTCLESGRISIKQKGAKELIVEPGQLIEYNRQKSTFSSSMVNAEEYSGWRLNKMYLHNEPLIELSKKLERKYNILITFVPETLGNDIHYSGIFSNENAEEVLGAIAIASGLKYEKKGNYYTITVR